MTNITTFKEAEILKSVDFHPLNADCDFGQELFPETCCGKGVRGVLQHTLGHEHRFVRAPDEPNRTEAMWLSSNCFRRVFPNSRLRRRKN